MPHCWTAIESARPREAAWERAAGRCGTMRATILVPAGVRRARSSALVLPEFGRHAICALFGQVSSQCDVGTNEFSILKLVARQMPSCDKCACRLRVHDSHVRRMTITAGSPRRRPLPGKIVVRVCRERSGGSRSRRLQHPWQWAFEATGWSGARRTAGPTALRLLRHEAIRRAE